MVTEEFSEVLDVVREILAYTKENQPELINPPKQELPDMDLDNSEEESDPTSNMGHDDFEQEQRQEEK